MTPEQLAAIKTRAEAATPGEWEEIQRLQILIAWAAGEITEGRATAMLKQYGGCAHGRLMARELKQQAIGAGKNLPFPKPLKVVG